VATTEAAPTPQGPLTAGSASTTSRSTPIDTESAICPVFAGLHKVSEGDTSVSPNRHDAHVCVVNQRRAHRGDLANHPTAPVRAATISRSASRTSCVAPGNRHPSACRPPTGHQCQILLRHWREAAASSLSLSVIQRAEAGASNPSYPPYPPWRTRSASPRRTPFAGRQDSHSPRINRSGSGQGS
jgi:hypothetical protein